MGKGSSVVSRSFQFLLRLVFVFSRGLYGAWCLGSGGEGSGVLFRSLLDSIEYCLGHLEIKSIFYVGIMVDDVLCAV